MTYKTHLSTGLLFSAIFFLTILKLELAVVPMILIVLSTILGSSTPDLDSPTSGIWHKVPAGSVLGRLIHPIFIGGHRHLSHSILGLGLFTLIFWFLLKIVFNSIPLFDILDSKFYLIAFAIGYFSHIFADLFTESGVPILFPWGYHFGLPPAPFQRVRIKTGKWFENLVVYPMVNILLVLAVVSYLKMVF